MSKKHSGFPATLRQQFGFSQSELASYLGISQSLVGMSEAHEREIKGRAAHELAKLAIMYEGDKPLTDLSHVVEQQAEDWASSRPEIVKEIERLKHQVQKKETDYQKAESELETLLRRMHALIRTRDHLAHPPEEKLKDLWLLGDQDTASKQRFLDLRIKIIKSKIEAYNPYRMAMKRGDILAIHQKIAFLE